MTDGGIYEPAECRILLDEVSDMMGGESHQQALGIVAKVDQELIRLAAPEGTKRARI